MTNKKTSEAQVNASRRWEQRNPERAKYIRYRTGARNFLRNHATEEDLQEMEQLIKERREKLKEE
jgi:hypothetical protein